MTLLAPELDQSHHTPPWRAHLIVEAPRRGRLTFWLTASGAIWYDEHMTPIEHTVQAIQQGTSECLQTAGTQTMNFYDSSIALDDVLANVPVYVNDAGEKIGTSTGHFAAYMVSLGFSVVTYVFDTEFFDRSWQGFAAQQVVANLEERQPHIPANSWLTGNSEILIDGWRRYAEAGGQFAFDNVSVKLLRDLLDDGPYMVIVNSNYLNGSAKWQYDKTTDTFVASATAGRSLTHAMTCAGYKNGQFLIVDPDPPRGVDHHRWIAQDHLIASIMSAQTESDNMVIVGRKG